LTHELDRLHEQLARLGELASKLLSMRGSDSAAGICLSCLETLMVARDEYERAYLTMRQRVGSISATHRVRESAGQVPT
jgi:hypothetical protein